MDVARWMAYERLEPFPQEQENWRNALLCTVIVNMLRGKDSKAPKLEDFLLKFGSEYDEARVEQIKEVSQDVESTLRALAPKGTIRVFSGDAPAIRRIGKRGRKTKAKERLWRILGV